MRLVPLDYRSLGQKYADCVSNFAIRGHIENEFRRGRLRIVTQRIAFTHKVVLVHIALGPSISFKAAHGHGSIMEPGITFVAGLSFAPAILVCHPERSGPSTRRGALPLT